MRREQQSGVALLAVLWLAGALSILALATAYLVRTEVAAVSNQVEGQRSFYLARGGIEAAIYSLVQSATGLPAASEVAAAPPEFGPGQRWLRYDFPTGSVLVEVVPENAKLNVNGAAAEQMAALFSALGLGANESLDLAAAIVDWRSPRASAAGSPLDFYYAALPQPYPPRHAPLEQLEELLPVKGMSRELFFGRAEESSDGRWRQHPALADLLTVEDTGGAVNPNYAAEEVLRALPGWNATIAAAVIQARTAVPFRSLQELQASVPQISAAAGLTPLSLAQGPVYTLTATGFLPDSKVRRSVRAVVRVGADLPLYHRVLAWWDDWSAAYRDAETAADASQIQGWMGQ